MEEKRTSRLYRGIRWGVKLVFPKFRLVEAEQLPETPCVIVGNHSQTYGPVAGELYIQIGRASCRERVCLYV